MTKDNPFPGMNPFLEAFWPDVHTTLISYIRDEIADQLPAGIKARSEEHIDLAADDDEPAKNFRADVAVVESWKQGIPPQWKPGPATHPSGLVATQPLYCLQEEDVERWIELRDRNGRLVTVIEVLSPANKEHKFQQYLAKRYSYITGGVNVVEIDLLRSGHHVLNFSPASISEPWPPYFVCTTRAAVLDRKEVYPIHLHQPLPNIAIPLRVTDADVVLPLQPLIDRCYRKGSYWEEPHTRLPGPPLGPEQAAWVKERLVSAGFLSAE